jgi:hypothetical protein
MNEFSARMPGENSQRDPNDRMRELINLNSDYDGVRLQIEL